MEAGISKEEWEATRAAAAELKAARKLMTPQERYRSYQQDSNDKRKRRAQRAREFETLERREKKREEERQKEERQREIARLGSLAGGV